MRSIFYVFLLGCRTGRIEPSEKIKWERLVREIHDKASEISLEEIDQLSMQEFENDVVQQLAKEMFASLRDAQKLHL